MSQRNWPNSIDIFPYKEGHMIRKLNLPGVIGAFVICVVLCPPAYAQGTGGMISGTVTDPSQGAVPGAEVTILNSATGQARKLVTNEQGYYSVPNLTSGRYDVTVSAPGFAGAVQKELLIEVGKEVVSNIQLQVGDVTESVLVEADPPAIALSSSTLSNVVSERVVQELPLNGRDWTQLAALEPGVHVIDAQNQLVGGSAGRANRGFSTQLSFGGNRPQQNNYRVDGISINDYAGGGPGNVAGGVLGVDAIGEFSVVTGNASAEYGRTSGGVINAITRSGTNSFHGSAFEFHRNSALDARNFFDKGEVPPFKRNQFGFAIGGPLYLPRFGDGGPAYYSGKDRTFFFAAYEGLRQSLSTTAQLVVPSRAARLGRLTSGNVSVDPRIIPYLALYPLPNGAERGDVGDFSSVTNSISTANFFTGRVDHKFSDADNLHGTFQIDNSDNSGGDNYNFTLLGQISQRKLVTLEYSTLR